MPTTKPKTKTVSNKTRSRVSNSSALKKSKFSFKPWHAVLVVALVALTGYTIVRFSSAAIATNSFEFNASQLSGGTLVSSGGESYRQLNLGGADYGASSPATVTKSVISNTDKVCARVKFLTDTKAYVYVYNTLPNGMGSGGREMNPAPTYLANTTQDFCKLPTVNQAGDEFVGVGFGGYSIELGGGNYKDVQPTGTVAVVKVYGTSKPVTPPNCKTNGTCAAPVASCTLKVAKTGSAWLATWTSSNLGTAKYGWDATLTNSATGNTTNNVGINGSRTVVPRVGYDNTYTIKVYDGWAVTNTSCSATVRG